MILFEECFERVKISNINLISVSLHHWLACCRICRFGYTFNLGKECIGDMSFVCRVILVIFIEQETNQRAQLFSTRGGWNVHRLTYSLTLSITELNDYIPRNIIILNIIFVNNIAIGIPTCAFVPLVRVGDYVPAFAVCSSIPLIGRIQRADK